MPKKNTNIILVYGTSSSGKSTLCRAIREKMTTPFWHFSSDHLIEAQMHPKESFDDGTFNWMDNRPLFFDAFHRSILAFADAGIDLVVEHVVEQQSWAHQLADLLSTHDVFTVATHCPMVELSKREKLRGNRQIGEAEFHMKTYEFGVPDIVIDTTLPVPECSERVIKAWHSRTFPCDFHEKWKSV